MAKVLIPTPLRQFTGKQDAVFLYENQLVSPGVGRSKPHQTDRETAEVEFCLAVKQDIRFSKFHILQQVLILR